MKLLSNIECIVCHLARNSCSGTSERSIMSTMRFDNRLFDHRRSIKQRRAFCDSARLYHFHVLLLIRAEPVLTVIPGYMQRLRRLLDVQGVVHLISNRTAGNRLNVPRFSSVQGARCCLRNSAFLIKANWCSCVNKIKRLLFRCCRSYQTCWPTRVCSLQFVTLIRSCNRGICGLS